MLNHGHTSESKYKESLWPVDWLSSTYKRVQLTKDLKGTVSIG